MYANVLNPMDFKSAAALAETPLTLELWNSCVFNFAVELLTTLSCLCSDQKFDLRMLSSVASAVECNRDLRLGRALAAGRLFFLPRAKKFEESV
jgi:hypothetical protein